MINKHKKPVEHSLHPRRKKRVPHTLAWFIVGAWVLVGVVFGLSLKGEKNVSPQVQSMPPIEWSITDVSFIDKAAPPFQIPKGFKVVKLNLSIKNSSSYTFNFAPVLQTKVLDSQGKGYDMSPTELENPIMVGPIDPGQTISGQLSYLVPADIESPRYLFEESAINMSEVKSLKSD